MTSIRVYVGDTGVLESPSTLTSMVFLTAEIKFSLPLYCIFLTKTLSQERRKHAKKTTIPLIRLTHNFQKPPVSRKKILASPISTQYIQFALLYFTKQKVEFFFIPLTPGALYTGRLRPEDQPLTVLYTIFATKDTRFVYLLSLLTHSTPFTYLLQLMVDGVTIQ